jgi:heme oxygenase (biliverdin-producing, ferredoxin)
MELAVTTDMRDILDRAAARVPYDIERRLAADPLSTVLRQATWGAHEEVESGPLEAALAEGRLRVEVYADLLAQSRAVYRSIETVAPRMAGDPVAGPFVRPEVFRTAHVERDLAYYWGERWSDRVDLLPETERYVERIDTVAAGDAIAWIAHGYTRYLADLSGGLVIDKAITEAYGLDQDGRWLYTFDLPSGVDPKTWKNAYRQLLNVLDLDTATAVRLVEEALVAYQCNIALNDALVARHGDIELEPRVA